MRTEGGGSPQGAASWPQLFADAGQALVGTLDGEEALRRLARLLVPHLADGCSVDVTEGDRVRRLAVVQRERATAVPDTPDAVITVGSSSAPLARVLRGGGPVLLTDLSASRSSDPLHAAEQELYEALGARQLLIVPLQVRRQVLGALTLVRTSFDSLFDEQTASLVADLAHLAGLILDNGRLFAQQQHIAEQLQLSLLPDLSGLRELDLASRYVPARAGAEVGGDWFDAFTLPDNSSVLAIGDVVGHDLTAAVRMAQLRNTLRALAYDSGDSPAGVMRRLDGVMQGLTSTELVTGVIVRVYTPPSGLWFAQWTNAGHPPPVLVSPEGGSRLLEEGLAPVLGVDPSLTREDALVTLPEGATLLLYTDGLIERPGEDIGRGLTRLRQHTASLAGVSLDAFCDTLLSRLTDGQHDDVALLALRVPCPVPTR